MHTYPWKLRCDTSRGIVQEETRWYSVQTVIFGASWLPQKYSCKTGGKLILRFSTKLM
jgi:hypothetical protein